MIITKKAIPRRTVLRGIGASLALPLLDGMVPALAAGQTSPARPARRLGIVYVPNGMMMDSWTPAIAGAAFEFTPTLQPLAPFRDRLLVLSGLNGAKGSGPHAGASTRFLTGVTNSGAKGGLSVEADVSMDQLIARELGRHTQLASLELSLDRHDLSGTCDNVWACAYTNTIAWRSSTTPLPMEDDPRAVFERLFGDGGSTDPAARLVRLRQERSILDSVRERVADLTRGLGPRDGAKLAEYLEAVRDIERRIQRAEEQNNLELPIVQQPAAVPATYEEYAKLMFDLQVLAHQCDLTRVTTFMMGRELSQRTFPEIGISDAWHPTSHHGGDAAKIDTIAKINAFQTRLFAYYLERLRTTADGDGSLLDHMMILYGAGMSDSNQHDPTNLPLLLAGGGAGQLRGGQHIKYAGGTPMANLLVTLMDKMGLDVRAIGNSTGQVEIDVLSLL